MPFVAKVATPPSRPLLIWDGECNFCKRWISRWQQTTRDRVDYLPLQDPSIAARFPELRREQLETSVHLVLPDGTVVNGAEAAFRGLAQNPDADWFYDWYTHSPTFARAAESFYRIVARHRQVFSWLTRFAWGEHVERPTHLLVRWFFLRGLALVYLAAFISLWVQIHGLVGSNGVLPARATMAAARQQFDEAHVGLDRYRQFPTLCWFAASDQSLTVQCVAGTVLSLLLLAGIAPAPVLFLLWLIYLSLSTIGQEFLSFQWDVLLLETGFLAIFFAPLELFPRLTRVALPSTVVLWLLRWLIFRLMFESGIVKLLSGDVTWRNLTALFYHYETQPLPTWIGWYAHQLPPTIQRASTAVMFFIELAVPFLIFFPRRIRHCGCFTLITLQVFIMLSGNYCFFNLLTIVLCLTLLDDFALQKLTRLKLAGKHFINREGREGEGIARSKLAWPAFVTIPLACLVLGISVVQVPILAGRQFRRPWRVLAVYAWLNPFRTFNTYGLFRVMTKVRNEIIIEGSNDGTNWVAYEFKYKPGEVTRRPKFIAPHQPRLDWQMWFAALGDYQQNPWFVSTCLQLLKGSPEVVSLLERNPFPAGPPRYLRAVVYEYHFTDWATKRKTGAWWRREWRGRYLPAISLKQTQE